MRMDNELEPRETPLTPDEEVEQTTLPTEETVSADTTQDTTSTAEPVSAEEAAAEAPSEDAADSAPDPRGGKRRKKRSKRTNILMAVLIAIFVCSTAYVIWDVVDVLRGTAEYDDAFDIATSGGQTVSSGSAQSGVLGSDDGSQWLGDTVSTYSTGNHNVDLLMGLDLSALRAVAPNVKGWLFLPDTTLSYPMVQCEDNEYYLDHTYRGSSSSIGSIYLDYRVAGDFSSTHTVIYGHRTYNGTMFSCLNSYVHQDFLDEHPVLYVRTDAGCEVYTVFSAYVGDWMDTGYQLSFSDDSEKNDWLYQLQCMSQVNTGVTPYAGDKILTLSTCTGLDKTQRMLVHAYQTAFYSLEEFYAAAEAEQN